MIQKILKSIFNYAGQRIFMKIASRLNKRPGQAQEKLKKFLRKVSTFENSAAVQSNPIVSYHKIARSGV